MSSRYTFQKHLLIISPSGVVIVIVVVAGAATASDPDGRRCAGRIGASGQSRRRQGDAAVERLPVRDTHRRHARLT